jgi:GMP synthase (glutamine-hydrolysing)
MGDLIICIIDCGTAYLQQLKDTIKNTKCRFRILKLKKVPETDFSGFSGIIISGAPTLLTRVNLKEYLMPFEFVKTTKTPIYGICLGHQIIGLLHGAKISHGKLIHKEEKIHFFAKDKIFSGIENGARFHEEHSESISLPRGFFHLAGSKTCKNEAMKHKKKKIYSTQFHPEASGLAGKKILENFLKIAGGRI